ncbi:hypothetical protein WJX74_003101 [Apatococcus lobatus]|uniref:Uncharacterized protein n=1 Tax=Apatococcus lobatus TaxID=904363 RepID=A0AAW1S6F2_9CHLO
MTAVRPPSSLADALHLFGREVRPFLVPETRDARSPRLGRLGSTLGGLLDGTPVETAQHPALSRVGSVGAVGLSRKASMVKLVRTASTRVTMGDVPALLFAALLRKLHEQQRGRPLEGSDATILQEAEEAYNRRSMLQRIMLGGDHRLQAVSFFQAALLHRLPTSSLRAWKGTLGHETSRSQGPPSSRTSTTTRATPSTKSTKSSPTTGGRPQHANANEAWEELFDYHPYLRGPTPRELASGHKPSDLDAIPPARRHIFKHLLDAPGYEERKTAVLRLISAKLRRPLTTDAPGSDEVMEVMQLRSPVVGHTPMKATPRQHAVNGRDSPAGQHLPQASPKAGSRARLISPSCPITKVEGRPAGEWVEAAATRSRATICSHGPAEEGHAEQRSHPAVPRLHLRPLSERSPLWYRQPSGSMPWASPGPGQGNPHTSHSGQPTPDAPRDPLQSLLQDSQQDPAGPSTHEQDPGSRPAASMHGSMDTVHQRSAGKAEAGQGQGQGNGQGRYGGQGQGRGQGSRWEAADRIAEGAGGPAAEQGGVAWGNGVQGPQPGPPSKGLLPPALDGLLQLHLSTTNSRAKMTGPEARQADYRSSILAGSNLLCGMASSPCQPLEKLKPGRALRRLLLVSS